MASSGSAGEIAVFGSEENYRRLRSKLLMFFQHRRCTDAEDLADETIKRVLQRISEGLQITTPDLDRYASGVAKNVFYADRDRRRAEPLKEEVAGKLVSIDLVLALKQCLERMEPAQRRVIERYILDDRDDLARDLGVSRVYLAVLYHRAKNKLLQCWQNVISKNSGGE